MVGVPHSNGCALCRERRIKVNFLTMCIPFSDRRSVMRELPGATIAFVTANPAPDIGAPFASRMRVRILPEDINPACDAEEGHQNRPLRQLSPRNARQLT
jgi:hypothetical protein